MTQETRTFAEFNLHAELLCALERRGFETPMPVQVCILGDKSLLNCNLIVQAKTGSGKTLAFALPLINAMDTVAKEPQIAVLSPTRELAQQTAREFAWIGSGMGVKVATLVGGLDIKRQMHALRDGANVVVGTPGRILDHIRRGTFQPESVKSIVLDEGDHMLDMGFREEMEAILEAIPRCERTWLFSATMPPAVTTLARQYLNAPRKISLVSDITDHEDIVQKTYIIPSHKRFEGLANVLIWEDPSKALLFCGTRVETQEIADKLSDIGFRVATIHGDMNQRERNSSLNSLRGGRVSILVATDVAARGLDIDSVSHVIQFGLPQNLEAFVHRSGRTGRAGHMGSNMLLLTAREAKQFKYMAQQGGSNLKMEWIPAPSAEEIEGQSRIRFEKVIMEHALKSDDYLTWAEDIITREDAVMLVSGLLAKACGEQPSGYFIREDVDAEMNREKNRAEQSRICIAFGEGRSGSVAKERHYGERMYGGITVRFAEGRADGWEVGRLLGMLCRCVGIGRDDVGNIKLHDRSITVELSAKATPLFEDRKERLAHEGLHVESVKKNREAQARPRVHRDKKQRNASRRYKNSKTRESQQLIKNQRR